MTKEQFTHTVHCYSDKTKRKHFCSIKEASAYANELCRQGHKVKIFPYSPPKRYIDFIAEKGPDGPVRR